MKARFHILIKWNEITLIQKSIQASLWIIFKICCFAGIMILQIGELLNVVSSTNIFRKTKAAHFTSGVRFFCSRKKPFFHYCCCYDNCSGLIFHGPLSPSYSEKPGVPNNRQNETPNSIKLGVWGFGSAFLVPKIVNLQTRKEELMPPPGVCFSLRAHHLSVKKSWTAAFPKSSIQTNIGSKRGQIFPARFDIFLQIPKRRLIESVAVISRSSDFSLSESRI